jgi:hypothetical protein
MKTLQERVLCENFFDYSHFHLLFQVMPVISNVLEKHTDIENLKLYFNYADNKLRNLEIANRYLKFFKIDCEFLQKTGALNSQYFFDNFFTLDCYKNIPNKNFLLHLRGFINQHLDSQNLSKNIIINRKNNRKIKSDFIDFFVQNHNFKEIILDDLDFQQQIDIFSYAENIIAVHGGALTNMVFCKQDVKIIELNSGFNPTCYNDAAKLLFKKINLKIDYRTILPHEYSNQTIIHQSLFLENFLNSSKSNLFKLNNGHFYTLKDINFFKSTEEAFINKNIEECDFDTGIVLKNLFD